MSVEIRSEHDCAWRAAAGEARQDAALYKQDAALYKQMVERLVQERDAARVSARSQKTKAQHARRAQQAMGARILTLEAALRKLMDPLYPQSVIEIARAALQPTKDNEEEPLA